MVFSVNLNMLLIAHQTLNLWPKCVKNIGNDSRLNVFYVVFITVFCVLFLSQQCSETVMWNIIYVLVLSCFFIIKKTLPTHL